MGAEQFEQLRVRLFHVGHCGGLVGRKGHQADLPQVDFLDVVHAVLVALLALRVEADGQAADRARLQERPGFAGQRHVVYQQAAAHVEAALVLFHVLVHADGPVRIVLPQERRPAALASPLFQGLGEGSWLDDVVVPVHLAEDVAVAGKDAPVFVHGLEGAGAGELSHGWFLREAGIEKERVRGRCGLHTGALSLSCVPLHPGRDGGKAGGFVLSCCRVARCGNSPAASRPPPLGGGLLFMVRRRLR